MAWGRGQAYRYGLPKHTKTAQWRSHGSVASLWLEPIGNGKRTKPQGQTTALAG
jgi:hypothetical protein